MIAGRGGVIQPEDEAEILDLQPNIRSVHVENAGHMIPWDDLEGFFSAFGDFLGPRLN
jgi:N-formylmaleamate deformylase